MYADLHSTTACGAARAPLCGRVLVEGRRRREDEAAARLRLLASASSYDTRETAVVSRVRHTLFPAAMIRVHPQDLVLG